MTHEREWTMVEEVGRGWRRVVPSPLPQEVVELDSIAEAGPPGHVVVAGGGGGVPVIRTEAGLLVGVEAVIDKDRTAALLARELRASRFVVLTGVPHVSLRFGTPEEEPLREIAVAEARALLAGGEFPRGSMGPKIEAVADYVENQRSRRAHHRHAVDRSGTRRPRGHADRAVAREMRAGARFRGSEPR